MQDRTGSKKMEITAPAVDEIRRAAQEHLKRARGVSNHGKPGQVPREGRPKLRGAPAAAAVMQDRH